MKENIALNVWMRQNWKDNFLNWNENITNIHSIALADHEAWVPDIELLNAANLPEIYTLEGGMPILPVKLCGVNQGCLHFLVL